MTSITQFPGVDISPLLQALRIESGYWFLSTPYTRYEGGIESAFKDACQLAGKLMQLGIPVFSPIAHSHPISVHAGIDPLDHAAWMGRGVPMIDGAHGLIVGKLKGWSNSLGMAQEIQAFQRAKKPIQFVNPESLR